MALRPNFDLVRLQLDNTVRGEVTGFGMFVGSFAPRIIQIKLRGDFDDDIRGSVIVINGPGYSRELPAQIEQQAHPDLIDSLPGVMTGEIGDASFGLNGRYPGYPYIEWFLTGADGVAHTRCVIEQPDTRKVSCSREPFSAIHDRTGRPSSVMIDEVNKQYILEIQAKDPTAKVTAITLPGHAELMRQYLGEEGIESDHGPITR